MGGIDLGCFFPLPSIHLLIVNMNDIELSKQPVEIKAENDIPLYRVEEDEKTGLEVL
jgi:hypothetical protein